MSVTMSQDLTALQELPAPRQLLGARKEIGFMLPWCFQSILLGALRYSCWASLAFQHQFWLLLILS